MAYQKRILIVCDQKDKLNGKYFYPTFALCRPLESTYNYDPGDKKLVETYGEQGKNLWRALEKIEGITFSLQPYVLHITKARGLNWSEVKPLVLQSLHEVYGPFKTKRENAWQRW